MAPLYKSFNPIRTVLYAALALFFSAAPILAATPYIVEGVKVDITAENAIAARDQAFAKAQIDAFTLLAKNLLPPERAASFTPPSAAIVSGMIKDYELTQEKLSSTRYSGTYTFRFKESPVHRFLGVSGMASPMSYESAEAGGGTVSEGAEAGGILILPYYQQGGDMLLWSPRNAWLQTWSAAVPENSSLSVPIGDLLDVNDIGDNQALSYDRARLKNLLRRYNASEAVLAVAIPGMPQADAMTINLYRTDRGGPELVQKIFIAPEQAMDESAMLSQGVARTRDALQPGWKNRGGVADARGGQPSPQAMSRAPGTAAVLASVHFNNLQEWAGLQRNISRIPGVSRVVIQSLSPREAILEISYAGDPQNLRAALAPYNVALMGDRDRAMPVPVRELPRPAPPNADRNFYRPTETIIAPAAPSAPTSYTNSF